MRKTATITTKGQLTVPVEVRRYLGVKEGDQVEFVSEDGRLFVRPLRGDNPFLAFAGTRTQGLGSLEDVNAFVRDLRDEDEGE